MNANTIHLASAQAARLGQPRHAIVSAVDPVAHAVKVRIQPEGVESGWLADDVSAAGSLRIAAPTEIGTQVMVAPVDGDAENLVLTSRIFDTVVQTPVSPATGKVAQPGEYLLMAGQGAPPTMDGGAVGAVTANAAWFHVSGTTFYAGAGNATLTITNGSVVGKVGGVTMTLSAAGLVVTGGKITSDTDVFGAAISLVQHVHTGVKAGSDQTGNAVG